MSISNDPRCFWCGTYGSPANFVIVFETEEGNPLCECEWCGKQEWFRRKASNGKED
jgi:hypothetical protein